MFFHQRLGCRHILFTHQHIKDDPAVIGSNKGRVGHIVPADLINSFGNFKKSCVGVIQRVAVEAGIDGGGNGLQFVQERIIIHIPDFITRLVIDDH